MNGTGITSSWLVAYILEGLFGFLGGKVIDKLLGKKTKIIPEDEEGHFDLTKDISYKNKFKINNQM